MLRVYIECHWSTGENKDDSDAEKLTSKVHPEGQRGVFQEEKSR